MKPLPSHARAVIVGGGVAGASLAYHLTALDWTDVVLLERKSLTSGTTWHAAGLVGRLRGSRTMARLVRRSAELYAGLEAETGVSTNWKECGSLLVARRDERLTQFKRSVALGRYVGIEAHVVGPDEVRRLWPLCRIDDLAGAMVIPHDGRVIPADLTQALVAGARSRGARIVEDMPVLAVETGNGAVRGVRTPAGTITTEVVVNCAGMWARELAARNGLTVPCFPVEHFYAVTRPIAGITPELPVLRDYDAHVYVREEVGGILIGGFEPSAKPWTVDPIPEDFAFGSLGEDWDQFEILMRGGAHRVPALETAQIRLLLNGPESFTPDGHFILGPAPGLHGYFIAAGFNSGGIASAGGAGEALAQWIVDGRAPMDLWSVDPRRFLPLHGDPALLAARMREVPGLHYRMAWPNREHETARDVLRSPCHVRLRAHGACFGAKMGFERALWFGPAGGEPRLDYTFGRPAWLPHAAREHRAAREGAVVFDQSSFAKLSVRGPDALGVLQHLAAGDLDVAVGRTVYTPLLNERGGYESDLTISRLGPDTFFLVTGTGQRVRDPDWFRRHGAAGARIEIEDVTETYATLSVMGPRAREVLSKVTGAALDSAAFPYGATREIEIAGAAVQAVRVSYVGELGWELYVPVSNAPGVYDAVMGASDVVNAGYYALDSLRLEKGYRAWGRELTPDDTPLEAGLGFTVSWDKPGGFLGREALREQRRRGLARRLVLFALGDPEVMAWGEEPVYRDGELAGVLTSAGYGHTVGAAVGMGYLPLRPGESPEALLASRYEVDVAGARVPARVSLRAWLDPTGARMKV